MEKKASKTQNLSQDEAIGKFRELVKHESVCLFTTRLTEVPLATRPMTVQKVSDDGTFWFLSPEDSDKNQDIMVDPRVQLFFVNTSDYEFLSVYGRATVTRDRELIKEMWTDIAKAWFPEGENDPTITVIGVTPEEGFYWDTKSGKLVSIVKILASAVSGKTFEQGVEGKISVH